MCPAVDPNISVMIICYNFERFIGECIESILAQTLPPREIIIADDVSPDSSWSIISKYARRHPESIKAFRQERNLGPHGNGVSAWEMARGDLLSALDGDDRWHPAKLEMEWKALQRRPDARLAYSNVRTIDEQGEVMGLWYGGKGPAPPEGDVFLRVASRKFFPRIPNIFRNELVYRDVYEEFGYDGNVRVFLDYDFKLRATARYPVAYSGHTTVDYRVHPDGLHRTAREIHQQDQIAVYRKNLHLVAERNTREARALHRKLEKQIRVFERKAGAGT